MGVLDDATLSLVRKTMIEVFADTEIELLAEGATPDALGSILASEPVVVGTTYGSLYQTRVSLLNTAGAVVESFAYRANLPVDASLDGVIALRAKGEEKIYYIETSDRDDATRFTTSVNLSLRRMTIR